eukprot:jgi/Picre1/35158/NNA_002620.t1
MLRQSLNLLRRHAARTTRALRTIPPNLALGEDPMLIVMASRYVTWSQMVASHGTTPALPGKTGERRRLSTGNEDEIDDVRYHKEADHTLEYLVEAFENLLDA